MFAATTGKAEVCKVLVENGSPIDQETQLDTTNEFYKFPMGREKIEVRGSTALICSIASFQDHVSQLFLRQCNAQPEYEDQYGRTVLMAAVAADNLSIIKELCYAKANPNRMTEKHITALIHAGRENKPRAVATLRQMGADTGVESQRYGTALMAAAEEGNVEALDALVDGEVVFDGVDRESRRGMTALTTACKSDDPKLVQQLLFHKADINKGTRYDETPMDMCVLFKSMKALKYLINAKANPDRLNRYGLTTTQTAMRIGDKDLITDLVLAYRPTLREQKRIELLSKPVHNTKDLAMVEMNEYSEAFYKEHDRMWGPNTGYESLI